LGGRDRIAHELGRARKSWKRAQKEEGGAEGGRVVFMVVEKSSKAVAHAPSPIRGPLNLGVATARLRLLYLILFIRVKAIRESLWSQPEKWSMVNTSLVT